MPGHQLRASDIPPLVVASYQNCTGNVDDIGDGLCNSYNNNTGCGYDEGECCKCTSASTSGSPEYDCRADPPCACHVTTPCPADELHDWDVHDTASAVALAEVVRCSGGIFNVTWRGNVVLDKAICVASGTHVNVRGADEGAGAQGGGNNRIFTVVDASLSVQNMTFGHGNASNGGAIYATRSHLSLEGTHFVNNVAVSNGGALHVVDGSTVHWDGGAVFEGNSAHDNGNGGAVFLGGNSSVWGSGDTRFLNNTSSDSTTFGGIGGAVYVGGSSSLSCDGTTILRGNHGAESGGAVYVGHDGRVSFSGRTIFGNNQAVKYGGAVDVGGGSVTMSLEGNTSFEHNYAGESGGAVHVDGNSAILSFDGYTSFHRNGGGKSGGAMHLLSNSARLAFSGSTKFDNNYCVLNGGGLFAFNTSRVSFSGEANFAFNVAGYSGGAAYVSTGAVFSLSGKSNFDHNDAVLYDGGAVFMSSANTTWNAEASFLNNTAGDTGGAVEIKKGAIASWEETVRFMDNDASSRGGAIHLEDNSKAFWKSTTTFSGNTGGSDGGAVAIIGSSTASWGTRKNVSDANGGLEGDVATFDEGKKSLGVTSFFFRSAASSHGGAVYVRDDASALFETDAIFSQNTANRNGGALLVTGGSRVSLEAEATFVDNAGLGYGGGLYVSGSRASLKGDTVFLRNECNGNGGGLVIIGESDVTFAAGNTIFQDNSAQDLGGAIIVSGVGVGPRFADLKFISNSAQVGGAVYVTASGIIESNGDPDVMDSPTVFDRCIFVDNRAETYGGAIDSRAGQDVINSTYFEGNSADVGGALRLAGTTSLHNCTFVDNNSGEYGGPAVSNEGFISEISHITFTGNTFECEMGSFLGFEDSDASRHVYDVVCSGCKTTCHACNFLTEIPKCNDQLANTKSYGGSITLETISIDPGYWRATNTSLEILPCYNEAACLGGITGQKGHCLTGYEGPYCSVCDKDYTPSLGFACNKCSDDAASIAVAALVALVSVLLVVGAFVYAMSGKDRGLSTRTGKKIMATCMRRLNSMKILIIVWQIITQFASVANIVYPGVYQRFLDGIDLISLDLNWIPLTGCIMEIGFHERLVVATTLPIALLAVFGVTFRVARALHWRSDAALQRVTQRHLSMVILLTFLVYSPVSSILFQMFSCDELDDGKTYLRADYRIECDSSKHEALQVYAVLMMILYTAGIPIFYATILYTNRKVLMDGKAREDDAVAKSISNLWELYKPNRMYYELVECARRVSLASVVVFIYSNTAAQIAVTLMMGGFFTLLSEAAAPYASHLDAWVSRAGHAIVCTSMYLALLLKVNVASETASSQRVFESILVAAHVCMILTLVGEAMIVACRSLRETQQEEPTPRFRGRMMATIASLEDHAYDIDKTQGTSNHKTPISGD